MPSNFTAIFDACVLYPAPLRDLLVQLALTDLFRARWTEKIHDEWMRNVLNNRPDLTLEQLTRTRELMDSHVRDCLVTGYEFLIPTLSLPDPNDCHVLAAAIRCNADVIVTANLSDFPETILSQHNVMAQHPDTFISDLIDLKPTRVLAAAEIHRKRLKQPPRSVDEYLETLLKQELSISVCMLRELYDET